MKSIIAAIFLLCLLSASAHSHQKVVVVPLSHAKKLGNVVTVAKSGGDFTSPIAAMASISDARYDNPYLIVIGPGIYQLSETLVMKSNVSVVGSGQYATILRGTISTSYDDQRSALVSGRGTGELSNLAIENLGGSIYSFGIFSFDATSFVIQNVRVKVSGGNNNRGIYLDGPDLIRIYNCDIQVYGTGGGGEYSYGIFVDGQDATIDTVKIHVALGQLARGIQSTGARLTVSNVNARASSASTTSYGLRTIGGSSNVIRQSILRGDDSAIFTDGGTTNVIRSSLIGGVSGVSGILTCVYSEDGVFVPLSSDCY